MKRTALFVAVALAGCGPSVKSVSVEPARVSLDAKGAAATLKASPKDNKGRPVDAAKLKVAWAVSNPQVATVDEAGKVTAVGSGDAEVTARVGDVQGSARLQVSIPAAISVAPAAAELRPGETLVLAVVIADETGKPVSAPRTIAWTSSDPAIATVADGKVVGTGPGTATVTAATGALRSTTQVTVKVPSFAKLVVRPSKLTLNRAGDAVRLKVAALDAKGNPVKGVAVSWRSSDGRVASVSADGTVKAMRMGKATIKVSAAGRSTAVPVVVRK